MPLLSNRRWLRFSIRTLLLAITIFCVWLGWQVSIVRERKALVHFIESNHGEVAGIGGTNYPYPALIPGDLSQRPGAVREFLGDEMAEEIFLKSEYPPALIRKTIAAFPEADIHVQ